MLWEPGHRNTEPEDVCFTQAFCTTASCAASRSVILTGLYNHTNGTYGHTHGCHHFSCFPDVVSLPALLREGGYRTGRVGKKHFAPESVFPFDWGREQELFGRDDVRMAEACRDFVRGEEPFFLYYCSFNPHRAGKVEDHPLQANSFGNPPQSFPGDRERAFAEDEVLVPPFLSDTAEVRSEVTMFRAHTDHLQTGFPDSTATGSKTMT